MNIQMANIETQKLNADGDHAEWSFRKALRLKVRGVLIM